MKTQVNGQCNEGLFLSYNYLLSAYVFQTLSRILEFSGEYLWTSILWGKSLHLQCYAVGDNGTLGVWWAAGEERPVHSATQEGRACYYTFLPLHCTSCNFFLLYHLHIIPQLWLVIVSSSFNISASCICFLLFLIIFPTAPILFLLIHFPNSVKNAMFFQLMLYDTAALDLSG